MFGEMICHGCNVISIIISKNKKLKKTLQQNEYNFKADFKEGIFYDKNFLLHRKGLKFDLIQDNEKKLSLVVKSLNQNQKLIYKKKIRFHLNKTIKKNDLILLSLLKKISYYVGMIYPGEDSIIKSISIDFNNKKIFNFGNSIKIYSEKKNPRYPFINNSLVYKNFLINFETLIRPKFIFKKTRINKNIIFSAKSIQKNVLIIGASNGIGKEILDILKYNKDIKIFATYNNNKISDSQKNVKIVKCDIQIQSKKLVKLIEKNKIKYIYYMATPKINLNKNTDIKKYHNFYFKYPITLLKKLKDQNIFFYYPSTIFINQKLNGYTSTKLKFENYIKRNFFKKFTINCPRLPEINTKQNINFFKRDLSTFIKLINSNKKMKDYLFFN